MRQKLEIASRIPSKKPSIGFLGEELAFQYLSAQGLRILERNWRNGRQGELDLIFQDLDGLYIFVEVKTRKMPLYECGFENGGFDSIDRRKRKKILTSALAYLKAVSHRACPFRIDALLVQYKDLAQFSKSLDETLEQGILITHVADIFSGF